MGSTRTATRVDVNGNVGESAPHLTLETTIDLEGNAAPQRLAVDAHKVVVSNGHGNECGEWRLHDVGGFRVEPSLGSSFLQAEVAGRWIDLFRRPGSADQQLIAAADWLNAHHRQRASEDPGGPPPRAAAPPGAGRGEPMPARSRRWRTTALLVALLRPFQGSVLLLLTLSLGVVAIEVIPPMLQGQLVDRVLKPGIATSRQTELLFLLAAIVAGLLLVRLAAALVGIWKGHVSSRVGTSMTANLRNALVHKLNELPLRFYDKNQVGMLMSQVAYDTETLHILVYHATSGVLLQSLQLAGIGVMLVYLNARLALVTLLPMPLIIAGSWYFARCLQPRHHHYWEAVGKQAGALMSMLSGMRVVKAFVQEDRESRRFDESSSRLRDSRLTVDTSTSTFAAGMGFLFAIGTLAAWYLGGRDVLFGQMTLGELTAFLQYLAMFYTPLTSITESTTWFANFFSVSRRICDLLDAPGENQRSQSLVSLDQVQGRVELREVSFGYEKDRPVLSNITFTIEPGEMIGVVGRSGSGKSTLASLIGRLYDADCGQILIDGIDVRQMDPRQLRRHVGMVPQEPFLFRGSIAENVAYGKAQAAPEQILLAAKLADAHDFIMRMPLAYSTQLGEGGSGLSGGERQRLSIARALLFDPAILILDEATASVDAESERAICRAMHRWAQKRTTIVIAHRLSTLHDADRLLVLDHGRLIEQGTQEELLSRAGLYSTLVGLQFNLNENRRRAHPADGVDAMPAVAAMPASDDGDGAWFPLLPPVRRSDRAAVRSRPKRETNGAKDCGLKWLDPATVMIANDGHGMLRVTTEGESLANVYAIYALPVAYQQQYISLRRREPSGHESEVGLIAALDLWPPSSQDAVRRSLGRRYLWQRIREIRQLRTSGNLLTLSALTDGGSAVVRLEKPGEGSQSFGINGLLLADAGGSYFIIPDRDALPKYQQRLLTLYFGD